MEEQKGEKQFAALKIDESSFLTNFSSRIFTEHQQEANQPYFLSRNNCILNFFGYNDF